MKFIAESMHNFDRKNFQRIAAGMPEQQDAQSFAHQATKTAEVFNELFRQLLAVFPALASKSPEDFNEMRRQWLLAFKENGITTVEQINAGMRVARKQEKPFMPSLDSSSHGAVLSKPSRQDYPMSASWWKWFTAIAELGASIPTQNLTRGKTTRITGWSQGCIPTCEQIRSVMLSCVGKLRMNYPAWYAA